MVDAHACILLLLLTFLSVMQVKNIELKKLVYMYLVHNADANATCRELALLAINSFQRDLNGPNQVPAYATAVYRVCH